jgi:hypothetical protein
MFDWGSIRTITTDQLAALRLPVNMRFAVVVEVRLVYVRAVPVCIGQD